MNLISYYHICLYSKEIPFLILPITKKFHLSSSFRFLLILRILNHKETMQCNRPQHINSISLPYIHLFSFFSTYSSSTLLLYIVILHFSAFSWSLFFFLTSLPFSSSISSPFAIIPLPRTYLFKKLKLLSCEEKKSLEFMSFLGY